MMRPEQQFDIEQAVTIEERVDLVVDWATRNPPMPRSEFKQRLRDLLSRQRTITLDDRLAIAYALMNAPRTPRGMRQYGFVADLCKRFGVSRQTLYALERRARA